MYVCMCAGICIYRSIYRSMPPDTVGLARRRGAAIYKYIYIYIYICICVCVCVHLNTCIHVCMYVCTYIAFTLFIDISHRIRRSSDAARCRGRSDLSGDENMYKYRCIYIYVSRYVCTYVRMYVLFYF